MNAPAANTLSPQQLQTHLASDAPPLVLDVREYPEFAGARTRVGKARDFLLNPSRRVCEVAFEAGFQSLSQFNRAFRKVAGQSPRRTRGAVESGGRDALKKRAVFPKGCGAEFPPRS